MKRQSVVLAVIFIAASATSTMAGNASFHRWAIVASDEVRECGLADLLTAKLSEQRDLELVERDQLELATRELELSALLGAEAAVERLKLGRLLSADALVLLSMVEHDGKKCVKLVASDCRYGARLNVDSMVFDANRIDALAERCVQIVQQTQTRFNTGIKHLVGVTPFLSNNLTIESDHLQSAFSTLTQNGLLNYPGVAVVELDEARAISRELTLSGKKTKTAVMPVIVEGEYKVSRGGRENEPRVHVAVRVRDGKDVVRQWQIDDAMSEVVSNLMETIPARILDVPNDQHIVPFNRREQEAVLASRAKAFARLGSWKQSSSLREAALLLAPPDVETRIALAVDCDIWIAESWRAIEPQLRAATRIRLSRQQQVELAASTSNEQLERFQYLTHHVEHLVHNRMLNPREAALLTLGSIMDLLTPWLPLVTNDDQLRTVAEQFFWNAVTRLQNLDFELRDGELHPVLHRWFGHTRPGQLQPWRGENDDKGWSKRKQIETYTYFARNVIYQTFARRSRDVWVGNYFSPRPEYDDSRTLNRFYRLLTEATPRDVPIGFMATLACGQYRASELLYKRLGTDEVREFYVRLRATKVPMYEFYARCGTLGLKVIRNEPLDRTAMKEVTSLIDEFNSRTYLQLDDGRIEPFYKNLAIMRRRIAERIGGVSRKRHPLPMNWIPRDDPQRRVTFAPIDGLPTGAIAITKCTDTLDLIRSRDKIYIVPEKGVVRQIFSDYSLQDAAWDGEQIWVATANSGIHVFSSSGHNLGRIRSSEGLPFFDDDSAGQAKTQISFIRLRAISPGRCIAVGPLSKTRRLWFAELTKDIGQGAYRAKVFHSATAEPPDQNRNRALEADRDANEIFHPRFLLHYSNPQQPDVDFLLIGRDGGHYLEGRQPLAVDLKTLDVSVFPVQIQPRALVLVDQGNIIAVRNDRVTRISPPTKDNDQWMKKVVQPRGTPSRFAPSGFLIRHHGKIVNGGATWRLLGENSQTEWLTETPLPLRYHFRHYGLSVHDGIVGWRYGDRFYRASIDDSPALPQTPDELYPFVPAEAREQHARAIREIERLGGHVGSNFIQPRFSSGGAAGWHTLVYLSKQWQGGDDGLALLKDLYNLYELQLVQADVSNEGIKHVGQLTTLGVLDLVETKVTGEALPELTNLDSLGKLRLEGTVDGKQFGDDCLKHLTELKSLQTLEIYGLGFTDSGLQHLANMSSLSELRLYSTAMTKDKLNEFRTSRTSFRWYDYIVGRN